MKYIHLFEQHSNIDIEILNDIVVGLRDMGFIIEIKTTKHEPQIRVSICSKDINSSFLYKDIKDVVIHIDSYLTDNGYSIFTITKDYYDYTSAFQFKSIDVLDDHMKMKSICIQYNFNI